MSRPARARGLKHHALETPLTSSKVAPRAGAWIETPFHLLRSDDVIVAPRAGAWIETFSIFSTPTAPTSRPARARGLKHFLTSLSSMFFLVAPRAGAWIETLFAHFPPRLSSSCPALASGAAPVLTKHPPVIRSTTGGCFYDYTIAVEQKRHFAHKKIREAEERKRVRALSARYITESSHRYKDATDPYGEYRWR